ncbi:MAG: DUF1232 domain-containing protein [Thermoanaerobaculia bacterium]
MGRADRRDELPIPQRFLKEAARPEAEARVSERLPAKLRRIADSRLVGLAREAYGYATHPAVSRRTKLLGAAALLYLIAPLDAVADWIPGLGYVDDAAVLTAFVVSVREGAKQVVSHAQQAAEQVVSHALSEARETWARRGMGQVCLSLWAATLAACVGLLYTGARRALEAEAPGDVAGDPFLWACLLAGALGLGYQLAFAWRVWRRWAGASPEIKEPLAFAIVSLSDWRQTLALALPVVALAALLVLRSVWAAQG